SGEGPRQRRLLRDRPGYTPEDTRNSARIWHAGLSRGPRVSYTAVLAQISSGLRIVQRGHMSKSIRLVRLLIVTLPLTFPALSHATLSTSVQRGEKTIQVAVPGRNAERCVIPKHIAGGQYADHDLKDESELCAIDENSNAAVCPKTNSTNPGLDLYSL